MKPTIVVQNNTQVTVATKRIYPDEEICHIYQGHFADTDFEKRRKLMQDFFHFTCTCNACTEKFPTYENLDENFDNKEYLALNIEAMSAFSVQDFRQGPMN